MSPKSQKKYNTVDLFAGAGGLSYGFLQTGKFCLKAAFESNLHAQKTYKKNHQSAFIYDDIDDIFLDKVNEKIGKIDVVIGGPPCQGFSNVNRQKNHVICHNNYLIKKFVKAVLHLQPLAFVMENVGMLKSDIHSFYVEEDESEMIQSYNIDVRADDILLLEDSLLFDGIIEIVSNKEQIERYLWDEKDYLLLNNVYRYLNNMTKLQNTLQRNKKKLLLLAEKLLSYSSNEEIILFQNQIVGNSLKHFYSNDTSSLQELCNKIKPAIMYQRMLSKSKELLINKILVKKYTLKQGLIAEVETIAVIDYIEKILGTYDNGYALGKGILSSVAFGVPQKRMRFVIIGVKKYKTDKVILPEETYQESEYRTVEDAIKDLEGINPSVDVIDGNKGSYIFRTTENISNFGKSLRDSNILYNHVSTDTREIALERFNKIQQGGNFHSLPPEFKTTYSDTQRTQKTIYQRLKYNEPSGTVVNVRKSMWIHPVKNRAISIREAARLQTFPDSFIFCGTKDSQYQQVGNAVPPLLAKILADCLLSYLE